MPESFNVWQFFVDGTYENVCRRVPPEQASEVFTNYTRSLGAQLGTTVRVIITDDGDLTCAEWTHGEGYVWPSLAKKEGGR